MTDDIKKKNQLRKNFELWSARQDLEISPESPFPRSSRLLTDIFQNLYRKFYISESSPSQPLYSVENGNDWDPFTLRFDWIAPRRNDLPEDGVRIDPVLEGNVSQFLAVIKNASSLGRPDHAEIGVDARGGFIAFRHPDSALLLLRKIIVWEDNVRAVTDGIVSRNPFADPLPEEEKALEEGNFTSDGICLDKVKEVYQQFLSESPDQFDSSSLYYLPGRAYTDKKDALTISSAVTRHTAKIFLDINNLRNAIAADCGNRAIASPYCALH